MTSAGTLRGKASLSWSRCPLTSKEVLRVNLEMEVFYWIFAIAMIWPYPVRCHRPCVPARFCDQAACWPEDLYALLFRSWFSDLCPTKKKMTSEIKLKTEKTQSIYVGSLKYSWLVCIGADGKDRQYVIFLDRNMLLCIAQDWPGMHNGWIQIPDNQCVAKHLALEITIRIAFCRGAWYGMCLHCSQVGPHWGPGSPWGPFSVFGSPFLFKVPIFSISGWRTL